MGRISWRQWDLVPGFQPYISLHSERTSETVTVICSHTHVSGLVSVCRVSGADRHGSRTLERRHQEDGKCFTQSTPRAVSHNHQGPPQFRPHHTRSPINVTQARPGAIPLINLQLIFDLTALITLLNSLKLLTDTVVASCVCLCICSDSGHQC